MVVHKPLYNYVPPLDVDLATMRERQFSSTDKEQYLHIGHFVSWYGACEFIITIYLQLITKSPDPAMFHLLTKGMDAGVKIERLRAACDEAGVSISPALNERLSHFTDVMLPLRNKLVHSHLYWPENGPLQVCSIGAPPVVDGLELPAADPFQIDGLTLYERGTWLNLFSYDLGDQHLQFADMPKILGTANFHSPLPSGHSPSYPKLGGHAKGHRRHQKPGPIWRLLLNIRKKLRAWGLWPRQARP